MRVIPVQGLILRGVDNIVVDLQAYTTKEILEILQIQLPRVENSIHIENIEFVSSEVLDEYIPDEYEEIKKRFPGTKTFALTPCRGSKWAEIYYLKIALCMVYIADRWENDEYGDFFKQPIDINGYFSENGIMTTLWNVKLGDSIANNSDFELTIPSYYTMDDIPDSFRVLPYREDRLIIDNDLQEKLKYLSIALIKRNRIANKLRSALNLLYNTLPFSNLDLVIPVYATVLETLLLETNEDNQRKKVAVRSACLIADGEPIAKKRFIANWVYQFYKYRNMIVHDGKSHVFIRMDEDILFNKAVTMMQHLIYFLIKKYVTSDINDIKDVKKIVKNNKINDGLENAFNYIDEKLMLYYEDEMVL